MVAFCSGWLSNVSCMIVTKKWLLWIIKFRTVGVCEAFVARGAWPSWNVQQLFYCTMSRAVLAEAVLSNVLYYIQHTKYIRQGSAIACRNFLLSVCFHKQCFPKELHTARKLSELTSIHRKTLNTHVSSKQPLRNVRYKPFAKGSASNYWGNRVVCMFVCCCTMVWYFYHWTPFMWQFNLRCKTLLLYRAVLLSWKK